MTPISRLTYLTLKPTQTLSAKTRYPETIVTRPHNCVQAPTHHYSSLLLHTNTATHCHATHRRQIIVPSTIVLVALLHHLLPHNHLQSFNLTIYLLI